MADTLQLRGGSSSEQASFTGASREVTVDTTLNTVRVHDGSTAGGHILAKASDITSSNSTLATALGISSGSTNFGTFAGSTISDNQSLKQILQVVEALIESKAAVLGVAAGTTDLGAFTGSTIADSTSVKAALQALETTLEAVDIDTDDMATLVGLAENVANLGTFTGSTIADNDSIKDALQSLETALELRSTIDSPVFTTLASAPEFRANGTGHLKLRAVTGNDFNLYLANEETLQITRDPSTGNPKFTAKGGTGSFVFNQAASFGGSVVISRDFPDLQLKSNGEKRLLFTDAGGGATAALKNTSTSFDFYVGGVASGNKEMAISADAVAIVNKITSPEYHSAGSHLKFKADTNDIIFYPGNTETLQITRHSGTGHPTFTANGGSGEFKFNQIVEVAGGLKLDSVSLTTVQIASESFADNDTSLMTSAAIADYVTANASTLNAALTELGTMPTTTAGALADLTLGEVVILDGATVTTAELNILDGVTATAAELNYVDGVTSAIQTQLDAKAPLASPTLTGTVNLPAATNFAAASDLTLVDNTADALEIKEGSNQYVAITTTDGGEKIEAFKNVYLDGERLYFNTGAQSIRLADNQTSALKIENHDGSSLDFLDFSTSNTGESLIFGAPNQFNNTITVGVDDTGYDVKFFGATASAYMLWDESADDLILAGAAGLEIPNAGRFILGSNVVTEVNCALTMRNDLVFSGGARNIKFKDNTYNACRFQANNGDIFMGMDTQGDNTIFFQQPLDINTSAQIDGTFTVGVDDTGYDVKFFGDTASAYALWDASADDLILGGAAGLVVPDGQFTLGSTAVTSTAAELNYVDGVTSNVQTQLDAKAALAGPTFTGTPAAPTAGAGTNTTQLATTAFVTAAIATTIDSAPGALDTLNELAAALGDDANFSTTVTNLINANETHIDNVATFSGVAKDSTHLATFTGSTISDNQTVKAAIQALETAVETKQATDAELTELATMASATAAALADLTEAEVQILDGATVTTAELNILDGVTSTAAELNILDGVTSTAAELNILDGVTSTAAELNILDGVTATAAELNYVDGVTSNVQTQLDAKLASSGAKAALDVDHLITLSGVSAAADNLGTFTGSTISDNGTVKAGIQELETAVETKQAADAELTELATMASATAAALADLTEAEVQILDGATVTTAELNILDGVTATAAELNILDGVTASAADINLIDGITNGTVIASKAIITDANKDITGGRNITISGELDAATLDISGDADIDGTTNLDAVDIDGAVDMASTLIMSGGLTNAADDTAAASAGVAVNQLYRNGSVVMIRVS